MSQTASNEIQYTVIAESCYGRITYVYTNEESAWFAKFYMGWDRTAKISDNAKDFDALKSAHVRYYDQRERTAPDRLPGFVSEEKVSGNF